MAHYNMGVELEHLERLEEAVKVYEKASSFVSTHLPQNAMLLHACQTAHDEASEKMENKQKASKQKKREKDSFSEKSTLSVKKKPVTTNLKPSSNRMYGP